METKSDREIWVYGDLRDEKLFGFSLNVLAKARELAHSVSKKVAVVLADSSGEGKTTDPPGMEARIPAGAAAETSIAHGADFVYILDNERLVVPRADICAAALAHTVRTQNPSLVLFPLTDFTRELAARSARICDAGLIAECADLRMEENRIAATCPAWGGEIMAEITFSDVSRTGFATVQPHAFQATEERGEPGLVERIRVDQLRVPDSLHLLSRSAEPEEKQKLEDAGVVVVGGAGLGNPESWELVRDLAAALGGEVGATRPPVLQHWVDEERLIGQTGKTVRPKLLFSIGTSGAVQYTAGIMEAKTIVAVNRDQNAPIFHVADLGIVADAKTFLPFLTSKVRQATMRKLADVLYTEDETLAADGFGARVSKLRETHAWTVEGLAQATGESPEFIEKVEKDEVTPPVSFLLRLANALNVDPGTFLREEQKTLIRSLRTQAFVKRTQNYSYQTLSPGAESDHLLAFMVTIEPEQAHKPVAYKHDGEEFIFVMEGDLKLTLGSKTHHLKPGESVHFNANIPHKLKNISNDPTRCLVVLYTP